MKHRLNVLFLALLAGLMYLASCTKDELSAEVEDYVDESVYAIQERGGSGPLGCFEFVFPITLILPDSTTVEVADYDAMKAAIADWKEANPGVKARPTFAFPIEVTNSDGEVITIADHEALHELRASCSDNGFGNHGPKGHGGHGPKGHGERGKPCFELVFPVSLQFPDGTTQELADRKALKEAVRAWKKANPSATERPELVFPLSVKKKDGTTVAVNSKDELKALKESCKP